jgi:hypothetical protein
LKKLNDQLKLDLEGAEIDILNYSYKNSELAQENEKLLTRIDNMDYLSFRGKSKGDVKLKVVEGVVDVNTKEPIITDILKPDTLENDNKAPVYDIEALSKDMNFNEQLVESNKDISQPIEQDKAMSVEKVPSSEERKESGDEFPAEEKPRSVEKEPMEDRWVPEIQEDQTEQLEEKKRIDDTEESFGNIPEDNFPTDKKDSMQEPDEKLQSEENLKLNFDGQGSPAKETPTHSLLSPGTQEEEYKAGQGATADLADVYKHEATGASMISNQAIPDIHKMYQSVINVKEKETKSKEEIMMMESERRYRNCLINTQAEWYTSQWLDIEITRNVYKENKYMECRLLFKNKCPNDKIHITKFEAVSYDTNGKVGIKSRVECVNR